MALDATLGNIIVNKHNSCFGISFKFSDLERSENPVFDVEPDRLSLCKWLSYCQYSLKEIKNGFAWKTNMFKNQKLS